MNHVHDIMIQILGDSRIFKCRHVHHGTQTHPTRTRTLGKWRFRGPRSLPHGRNTSGCSKGCWHRCPRPVSMDACGHMEKSAECSESLCLFSLFRDGESWFQHVPTPFIKAATSLDVPPLVYWLYLNSVVSPLVPPYPLGSTWLMKPKKNVIAHDHHQIVSKLPLDLLQRSDSNASHGWKFYFKVPFEPAFDGSPALPPDVSWYSSGNLVNLVDPEYTWAPVKILYISVMTIVMVIAFGGGAYRFTSFQCVFCTSFSKVPEAIFYSGLEPFPPWLTYNSCLLS